MNLLIVDDQRVVVEGIVGAVNWERLGIDQVFEAYSGAQAMDVIRKNEVSIVLTDIEMPGINGLSLAEWISGYAPNILIVFLTAHADFSYAQQAVHLGAFDFVVQPVEYRKLEETIRRAMEKVEQMASAAELSSDGRRWKELREEMERTFWKNVLLHKPRLNLIQIEEERAKIGLELNWQDRYFLVMTRIVKQTESLLNWGSNENWDMLRQNLALWMKKEFDFISCFIMDETTMVYIVREKDSLEDVSKKLNKLNHDTSVEGYCELACYLSGLSEIGVLYDDMALLLGMDRRNVVPYTGVFVANEKGKKEQTTERVPSSESYAVFLREHRVEELREEIHHFIDERMSEGSVNEELLLILQQTLLHAVHIVLAENHEEFQLLFQNDLVADAFTRSERSLKTFFETVDVLLNYSEEHTLPKQGFISLDQETVENIKKYVAEHLNEKFGRTEIAAHVCMSKDYVSHLFKKAEGINLVDYINEQRLKRAMELLRFTNTPVNEIAAQVGIDNYAYFSKLIKKKTGLSAKEYRSRQKGK